MSEDMLPRERRGQSSKSRKSREKWKVLLDLDLDLDVSSLRPWLFPFFSSNQWQTRWGCFCLLQQQRQQQQRHPQIWRDEVKFCQDLFGKSSVRARRLGFDENLTTCDF